MDKVIEQSTANLLSQYIDLANQYGWNGWRQMWFRLQHLFHTDLQKLINSTKDMKTFLSSRTSMPEEDVSELVKEIQTGEVKTPSTESME